MSNYNNEHKLFHEIKNSITIIECSLKLIQKSHPEVHSYDLWDGVLDEFQYLRNLIGIFSQSDSGKLSLTPISAEALLNSVIHSIEPITAQTGFAYKFSLENDLPNLYVDPNRLKSCMVNIIKNAYEAMHQTGTLFISILKEQQQVRIDIRDSGGGIPKEKEPYIFETFYTDKPNGHGLGLPIAKQFITEMGGNIICTSRPGDGCTFSLILPAFVEDKNFI